MEDFSSNLAFEVTRTLFRASMQTSGLLKTYLKESLLKINFKDFKL